MIFSIWATYNCSPLARIGHQLSKLNNIPESDSHNVRKHVSIISFKLFKSERPKITCTTMKT